MGFKGSLFNLWLCVSNLQSISSWSDFAWIVIDDFMDEQKFKILMWSSLNSWPRVGHRGSNGEHDSVFLARNLPALFTGLMETWTKESLVHAYSHDIGENFLSGFCDAGDSCCWVSGCILIHWKCFLKSNSHQSIGEGNSNPLQYSCLENPMERGAWQATVHGVTESWTRLITHACNQSIAGI